MQTIQPIYCVNLFGGLRVSYISAPLAASAAPISRFRTHQTGALLAYLAHRAGHPQSREVLIEILWPGASQDSARHSLSMALSSLRSQFEGAGSTVLPSSIFLSDRLTIGVSRFVTTDVAQFNVLMDEAQALRGIDDPKRRDLTAAAVALYRPELLPGYYQLWVTEEQERLTDRAREAFLWLAQYVAMQGDRLSAIGYARQAAAAGYSEEAEALLERLEQGAERFGRTIVATTASTQSERVDQPELLQDTLQDPLGSPVAPDDEYHAHSSLPVPLTRFLGREKEMRQLRRWIERQEARLIVLTGPAGVGKSRVLRESVSQIEKLSVSLFALDLAPLAQPHELPKMVAAAVGIGTDAITSVTTIAAALAKIDRPVLLLDNIEQLLPDAGEWLESLLAASPHLTCVVTSRRRLDIDGEHVLALRPLASPDENNADNLLSSLAGKVPSILSGLIDEWPSVALFVDRARSVRPDFALSVSNLNDVLAIVAAVDGLPLALELAAAWVQVMTLPEMRRRLQADRFGVLQRRGSGMTGLRRHGHYGRHASLREVIAQSAGQLDDDLRQMLASLSVFRGGWTVAAAEAITGTDCALDHLAVLCDLSLVTSDVVSDGLSEGGTTVRFSLLESVREYAVSLLLVGSLAAARARHASYFAALVAPAADQLQGKYQAQWLDRLQQEGANLREALAWSRGEYGYAESSEKERQAHIALSMGEGLGRYWFFQGMIVEGRAHFTAALARPRRRLIQTGKMTSEDQRKSLSKVANGAAIFASRQGDEIVASRYYRIALFLDRRAPETTLGEGAKHAWMQRRAALLNNAGSVNRRAAQYVRSYTFFDESLQIYRELGEMRFVSLVLSNLALVDRELGRIPEAILNLRESLDVARQCEDNYAEARCLLTLGEMRHASGDWEESGELYQQALRLLEPIGNLPDSSLLLFNLGALALEQASLSVDGSGMAARERGECLVASALRSFIRTETIITPFMRQMEERLRTMGLWPESLANLMRWQAANFPRALPLSEAIKVGLLPPLPLSPSSVVAKLPH